jgi:hypothetical protein
VDGGFERMVTRWRPVQGAVVESLTTTHSTEADGHVGTEVELRLRTDG